MGSEWSQCTMGCEGGAQTRSRSILAQPKNGGRACSATADSRPCDTGLDLVLAIEASSSSGEELKSFVAKNLAQLKGRENEIGIVQFGNGVILGNGSIAAAKVILGLTSDEGKVMEAVEGLGLMNGFTNMAQALTEAEKLLHRRAQSAVMMIQNGKPSFIFQTKHNKVQNNHEATDAPTRRELGASMRSPMNRASISGLAPLAVGETMVMQKYLVIFCPNSFVLSKEKN